MSHHTEGDRLGMTTGLGADDHPDDETPFPFTYEDDGEDDEYFGEEIDLGGYTRADEERDREFRIREQALGAAMELNGRHDNPAPYADMVIADAEKFAAFLRGTLVTSD